MAFNKNHAAILADGLSDNAQDAMLRLSGRRRSEGTISQAVIDELLELALARRDTNLMDGKQFLLLTSRGKKVAAAIEL